MKHCAVGRVIISILREIVDVTKKGLAATTPLVVPIVVAVELLVVLL